MGIGPFLRYYVSIGDASSFFLGASYHYSRQQSESEYEIDYQIGLGDYDEDDESDPIDQSSVNFSAGLSVAISENIAIEPSISFSMIRVKTEEEVETNIYDMWGDYDYTIYTDEERIDFLNNFSFGVAASFFF